MSVTVGIILCRVFFEAETTAAAGAKSNHSL